MSGTGSLPGDAGQERGTRGPGERDEAIDAAEATESAAPPEPLRDSLADSPPDSAADSPADPPGDGLPDAPLFALLRTVAERIGVHGIERIWLFPPRRLKAGETAVLVVAAYHEIDEDRRRVYAAHYTAPADSRAAPRLALDEFGTAPADRVGRVVEEVVERIKDDAPAEPPRSIPVEGSAERWTATLHELAEQFLEEASRNPRLR